MRLPRCVSVLVLLVLAQSACSALADQFTTNRATDLDRQLTAMETAMRQSLSSYRLPGDYRQQCAESKQHDRAIAFFCELVAAQTNHWRARLELACAYVDKIPTCSGVAAFVNQGALARKALDQADLVVASQPELWAGYYVRGMNHLHWPRAFGHSEDAIKDFKRCLKIQEKAGGAAGKPYYLRVHVALGDAHTKAAQFKEAREAWQRGLKAFPNSKELKARLDAKDTQGQVALVDAERSLDKPVNTTLSFLDSTP